MKTIIPDFDTTAHDDFRIVQMGVDVFKIERRYTTIITITRSQDLVSKILRFLSDVPGVEVNIEERWRFIGWTGSWNPYYARQFKSKTVEEARAKIEEILKQEEIAKQSPRIVE